MKQFLKFNTENEDLCIKQYLPAFIMGKAIGDLEIFLSIILHLQNVSTIYQEMERDGEHIQKKKSFYIHFGRNSKILSKNY